MDPSRFPQLSALQIPTPEDRFHAGGNPRRELKTLGGTLAHAPPQQLSTLIQAVKHRVRDVGLRALQ